MPAVALHTICIVHTRCLRDLVVLWLLWLQCCCKAVQAVFAIWCSCTAWHVCLYLLLVPDPLLSSQSTHLFSLLIMALYCPLILALIQAKQPGNCAIYACPCCRGTTAQPVWIIHDGLSLLGQHITLLGQHHTIVVQRWMFEVFWSIASLAVQLQVDAVCSLCRARVVKIRAIGLTVELPSGSAMALLNCNLGKIISRLPT